MIRTARKNKTQYVFLRAVFLCLLFMPLTACKDKDTDSAVALFPLSIVSKDGSETRASFKVERAITMAEQEKGLMFREVMAQDHGMIFIYPKPAQLYFWMKNTYIPLDMIFINDKNEIIHIFKNAKPHDLTHISSGGISRAALEINAGLSDKFNISVGDRIIFNDYP